MGCPLIGATWLAFLWAMLCQSLVLYHLWTSSAWQLPLRLHVPTAALAAAIYLRQLPDLCPAPAGSGGGIGLFQDGRPRFAALAAVLDFPFDPALSGRPPGGQLSDAALCVAVLAWWQLALGLAGCTAALYLSGRQDSSWVPPRPRAPAAAAPAGPQQLEPARRTRLRGWRDMQDAALGPPESPGVEVAMHGVFASLLIWWAVRSVCVALY